jgi:hypothetical protein
VVAIFIKVPNKWQLLLIRIQVLSSSQSGCIEGTVVAIEFPACMQEVMNAEAGPEREKHQADDIHDPCSALAA